MRRDSFRGGGHSRLGGEIPGFHDLCINPWRCKPLHVAVCYSAIRDVIPLDVAAVRDVTPLHVAAVRDVTPLHVAAVRDVTPLHVAAIRDVISLHVVAVRDDDSTSRGCN